MGPSTRALLICVWFDLTIWENGSTLTLQWCRGLNSIHFAGWEGEFCDCRIMKCIQDQMIKVSSV